MALTQLACGRAAARAVALLLLLALAGCGGSLKTYPVRGRIVYPDGNVQALADAEATVQFMSESDPEIRAYGRVEPDGSFEMYTTQQGKSVPGVVEGAHRVRLVLNEMPEEPEVELDDNGKPIRTRKPVKKGKGPVFPVHVRYLDFGTSKWTCTVPASGDVELKVSKK